MVVQQRDARATEKINGYQQVSVSGRTKVSLGQNRWLWASQHSTEDSHSYIVLGVLATPLKDLLAPASSDKLLYLQHPDL